MNMETMNAMKKGKDILKGIHGNLYGSSSSILSIYLLITMHMLRDQPLYPLMNKIYFSNIDRVEQEMEDIQEQMQTAAEISAAISNPVGMGNEVAKHSLFPLNMIRLGTISLCRKNCQNLSSLFNTIIRSMKTNYEQNWTN